MIFTNDRAREVDNRNSVEICRAHMATYSVCKVGHNYMLVSSACLHLQHNG